MDKNKPKVLYILPLPPPVHGSSIVGRNIKNSKQINSKFCCDYINLSTSKAIDEIGKSGFAKVITYFLIINQLLAKLLTKRYDLCYIAIATKGVAFYKDLLLVFLVKLFRIKIVYHLHNKGVSKRQNNFIDNLLYRFAFHNTSVILLSELLYNGIQKYVPRERVHICPNGITEVGLRSVYSTNGKVPEILFLSNLIKSKGVFDLLDACAILKDKGIEFSCNYIGGLGDVNESEFNKKIEAENLANYVHYLGPKYREEKKEAFQNADIFSFPTYYHYECFPLVLLEAMSAGLPIVTTNEGGIPDLVQEGKNGYICETRDVETLAQKLEILIKSPELRKEMGQAGKQRFKENFTIQQFETCLSNTLTDIIRS